MKIKIQVKEIKRLKNKTIVIFNYGLVILEAIVKGEDMKIYLYQDLKHSEVFRINDIEEKKLRTIVKDILKGKNIRVRKMDEIFIEGITWDYMSLGNFVYIRYGVLTLVLLIRKCEMRKKNLKAPCIVHSARPSGKKIKSMRVLLYPCKDLNQEYLSEIKNLSKKAVDYLEREYSEIYGKNSKKYEETTSNKNIKK